MHVIRTVEDYLDAGYRVLGCLEVDESFVGKEIKPGIKVIGMIDDLGKILREHIVDELVFAMPLKGIENAHEYIALAEVFGVPTRIIPDWQIHRLMYQPDIASIRIEDFLGIPTMAFTTTPAKPAELLIKTAFDYVTSAIGLVIILPLFLVISLCVKLTSKGPVFFKQDRCGLNGRRFQLLKFRTMVENAEELKGTLKAQNEMTGPVFKITNDPRVTLAGRILRKLSLDELPQPINILRGEMSLVGPRPPIPSEVENYELWQMRRLSMKPGITCIWQVNGRNHVEFGEWMKMDLQYIDNWSIWLDLKLLLATVPAVLMATGK